MKWILCGKGDAAVAALEYLVEQGDEVQALGVRGDTGRDDWQRSFVGAARQLGVPIEQPPRVGAPELAERLAAFGARALISIQYDQILKGPLFEALPGPCLNLHFSLLPRHRGMFPIAWAILSGDDEAGVTLHQMVEDIDAGDLIAQRRLPIGREQTARELYEEVSAAAVALFRESYPFADGLLARRLAQDAGAALYHRAGDLDFSERTVDWSRPAAELQRWLRAFIFPPFQRPETTHGGRRLEVTRVGAELGSRSACEPGEVLRVGGEGVDVACADGSVRLLGAWDPDCPAAPAAEVLGSLRPGDRLEGGPGS